MHIFYLDLYHLLYSPQKGVRTELEVRFYIYGARVTNRLCLYSLTCPHTYQASFLCMVIDQARPLFLGKKPTLPLHIPRTTRCWREGLKPMSLVKQADFKSSVQAEMSPKVEMWYGSSRHHFGHKSTLNAFQSSS